MKCYLVQTVDIWSNVTFHGVFKNLEHAEKVIKEEYSYMDGIEDLELVEYAGTFGPVFDTTLSSEDDYLRVFGYIMQGDDSGVFIKYEED